MKVQVGKFYETEDRASSARSCIFRVKEPSTRRCSWRWPSGGQQSGWGASSCGTWRRRRSIAVPNVAPTSPRMRRSSPKPSRCVFSSVERVCGGESGVAQHPAVGLLISGESLRWRVWGGAALQLSVFSSVERVHARESAVAQHSSCQSDSSEQTLKPRVRLPLRHH